MHAPGGIRSASERPKTHALDRAATGIGTLFRKAIRMFLTLIVGSSSFSYKTQFIRDLNVIL